MEYGVVCIAQKGRLPPLGVNSASYILGLFPDNLAQVVPLWFQYNLILKHTKMQQHKIKRPIVIMPM